MILRLLPLLYFLFQTVTSQYEEVYFPDESIRLSSAPSAYNTEFHNISELRGTPLYEKMVDTIIAKGISKLTLSIDKSLTTSVKNDEKFDSIVFAPVSIAGALALLMLGSNGKTFQEITDIMGLATGVEVETKSQIVHEQFGRIIQKLQQTSGFDIGNQVNFATAIFVQEKFPLRTLYKTTAESIYESEVLNLNFDKNPVTAQQVINAWVSDRTKGKIQNILTAPPSPETKVILASAMYFKAKWEFPFFDGTTRKRPFYINGAHSKSDVSVEMMTNGGEFPYFKDDMLNCEIIGFPYKGNQTTMYVIKPMDSDATKLRQLESQLTPSEIERLVSNVNYTQALVLFPKMTIDSTIDLTSSLKELGVRSAFNPSQADFSLLSPGFSADTSQNASNPNSTLPPRIQSSEHNPIAAKVEDGDKEDNSVLIFSRIGEIVNCSEIFNPNTEVNTCQEVVDVNGTKTVIYKKFGNKVGRRIVKRRIMQHAPETLDTIRQYLNQNPHENLENPGLFIDQVIHKVYMDITESGTEAAASTITSLSRSGGRVIFRADVPFLFFIMHEETKIILFWGSVNKPTPNFPNINTD